VQRIVGRTPVPVIPMALQGLWGSFFSRKDGPAMSKPLRRGMFSKIALTSARRSPPAAATPEHLQEIVAGLRGDWRSVAANRQPWRWRGRSTLRR
jgi:1-acyl-sn-glycerol-3-phosphate acyltransferase